MAIKRAELREKMRLRKRKGLGPSKAVREYVKRSKKPAVKAEFAASQELARLNRGGLIRPGTAKLLLGSKGRQQAGKVGGIAKLREREALRIRRAKRLGISVPQMLKRKRK